MPKYDFYDDRAESIADLRCRIAADCKFSVDWRTKMVAHLDDLFVNLSALPRFAALDTSRLPSHSEMIEGALARLREHDEAFDAKNGPLTMAGKEIIAAFDLRHPARWAALSPATRRLCEIVHGSYLKNKLSRLFSYMSTHGISEMSDALVGDFNLALQLDPSVKNPDTIFVNTLRSYNKAAAIDGWPQHQLTVPRTREVDGKPWTFYGEALRDGVEKLLERRPKFVNWDPQVVEACSRDTDGLAHSVELVRICAGALVEGDTTTVIKTVRDLVTPRAFRVIATKLAARENGDVTRLVWVKLVTLARLADVCGKLSEDELIQLHKFMKNSKDKYDHYVATHPSRVERNELLKDPAGFLKLLKTRVLEAFPARPPVHVTRSLASNAKQLAMLAIRVETGFTSVIIRQLRLDRHVLDTEGTIVLRVPAAETANGRQREGILAPAFATILRGYIQDYRRKLIMDPQNDYVFPGIGVEPLHLTTISSQQIRWLTANVSSDAKPESIRKAIRDFIYSTNADATGVVQAVLGLADTEYVDKLAKPFREKRRAQEVIDDIDRGEL